MCIRDRNKNVAQDTYVYTEVQSQLENNYNALRFPTRIHNNENHVDRLAEALGNILS